MTFVPPQRLRDPHVRRRGNHLVVGDHRQMVAGNRECRQHRRARAGAGRDRHIQRVRSVVAEHMKRIVDVFESRVVEQLAARKMDVEAVIHRAIRGSCAVQILERWLPFQLPGASATSCTCPAPDPRPGSIGGLGAGLHVEVADEQHVRAFAQGDRYPTAAATLRIPRLSHRVPCRPTSNGRVHVEVAFAQRIHRPKLGPQDVMRQRCRRRRSSTPTAKPSSCRKRSRSRRRHRLPPSRQMNS